MITHGCKQASGTSVMVQARDCFLHKKWKRLLYISIHPCVNGFISTGAEHRTLVPGTVLLVVGCEITSCALQGWIDWNWGPSIGSELTNREENC